MYAGTSILATVKAAAERGWYHSYRWAFNLNDLLCALSWKGPVLMGSPWYGDMMQSDKQGFIHVNGKYAGGHGYVLTANHQDGQAVQVVNSWGREWGFNSGGCAWLSHVDLGILLSQYTEACIPTIRSL
jgi:hypothetical protein